MQKWNWVKRHRQWIICVLIAGAVVLLIYQPDWTGFGSDSTTNIERDSTSKVIKTIEVRQSGKTLWDWISVLGVPLSLAILGFWFQSRDQKRAEQQATLERELARANQREDLLQSYLDRVSTLLIDKQLIDLATKNTNPALLGTSVDVIRARTLSILRQFGDDGERKASILRFLIEAEVIKKLNLDLSSAQLHSVQLSGVNLRSANLHSADFSHATLKISDLSNAKLRGTNFHNADLSLAILSGSNLSRADLSECDLRSADLHNANLRGTNLNGAILLGSNLSTSKGLDSSQFTGVNPPLLCATRLPSNMKHLSANRDCALIPEVLRRKYPDRFETQTKAIQEVDSAIEQQLFFRL
jgi:hypothetical protein